MSVSKYPGQMALTRMPRGPNSLAKERVKPINPAFVAAYTESPAKPRWAMIEEMLMILPPLSASMRRCAFLGKQDSGAEIHGQHLLNLPLGHDRQDAVMGDRGIVDEAVNLPKFTMHRMDEGDHCIVVTDVERTKSQPSAVWGRLKLFDVVTGGATERRDDVPAAKQAAHDGQAKASIASGDKDRRLSHEATCSS